MASRFDVERAELAFEAGYVEPAFELLRDVPGLLRSLFAHLSPHGLRLADMRFDRAGLNVADHHVFCYLFDFVMTAHVRIDKIEVLCSQLPQTHVQRFGEAIVAFIRAVQAYAPHLRFRAHAMAVNLHGRIEGIASRDYLSRFIAGTPSGLGPSTGNAVVFYFGQEEDRLLSSLTLDLSAAVADAVYVRPQVVWDASKVEVDTLIARGEAFVRKALNQVGLELVQ